MKRLWKLLKIVCSIVGILGLSIVLFMQQNIFGKLPAGARLAKIARSPHYKDGAFQNLSPTPMMAPDASYLKMTKDFFSKPKSTVPPRPMPSVRTDLKTLQADTPVVVWFGHSSYLIQYQGIRILVDPVFSGNASPVGFGGKAFAGTDVYNVPDFGPIDLLLITHDHYDHLDYKTILKLIPQTKVFYTALGVGSHLEYWGVPASKIVEFDWWDTHTVSSGIELIATPARHFSGRGFTRNKTLWTSFVLKLHGYTFYIGGDSGYDTHFKTIGDTYGPFDLVMLEAGQYGKDWPYIHMFPEETVQAAKDLKAKALMPVHWGKFALAFHDWNEPIRKVVSHAAMQQLPLAIPRIGEVVQLHSPYPTTPWWEF